MAMFLKKKETEVHLTPCIIVNRVTVIILLMQLLVKVYFFQLLSKFNWKTKYIIFNIDISVLMHFHFC